MMRKILLVLSLAFAIIMLPCVSLADDDGFSGSDGGEFYQNYGLRWSGFTHDGEWTAVLAKAPDSWYAAVLACGGNPALLTPEVRSKLSDPSYGGAFYTYATNFYHIMSIYDLPVWVPVYVLAAEGISGVWHGDFGDVWLWQSEVPNSLAAAALVDYNKVVKGEDVGGGGGSGGIVNVSDCVELTANYTYQQSLAVDKIPYNLAYNASIDSSGNVVVGSGEVRFSNMVQSPYYVSNPRIYVSRSVLDHINDEYAGKQVFFFVWNFSGSDMHAQEVGYCVADSFTVSRITNNDGLVRDGIYATNATSFYSVSTCYHDSDGVFFVLGESLSSFAFRAPFFSRWRSSFWEVVPPTPDGEWPEPTVPVTPDPPEVPTPTAPTETVDPDPTAPTITWPTAPTLVLPTSPIVSTTPEGIDYTALLTLINDNLNSIDAYLQNFYTSFNSFRSDFLNGVDDIVDALRNIYQYLGHLNNILEVHCKHITDQIEESVYNLELYLKRLFEWLPKQLDFDAEYDDSAVTALLRRILNKIPGSSGTPVSYKPNPQSDEPSFWDWLADLFNRILQKLLDLLPDEMIQLGQLFGELINLFPFSIPWDLFALLALFGHEPVTPVIDIPWGYGGSDGQVMMIRIDLHAWDGVAEMVRPVFLVLFCLQLALLSRDLLKIINVKSGGE